MKTSSVAMALCSVFLLLGSTGCSATTPSPDDSTDDALMITGTPAYYFASPEQSVPAPGGADCLQRLNTKKARKCLGSVAPPELNVDERTAFRDALVAERVIVHAALVTVSGLAAAGSQMVASDAWVSSAVGAPTKDVFLVKSVGGALEATLLNTSSAATVLSSLDLAATGTAAEIADAKADLDGAGLIVSGDLDTSKKLAGDRFYRHIEHVPTMYDAWRPAQGPGGHLAGATFKITPGAQLSFSLTSSSVSAQVEATQITGFTAPAPLVISERRSTLSSGTTYAFYDFRVPSSATAGQTFAVHSTPAPGAVGDPKWDFGFTIEVAATCGATFPDGTSPQPCK